MTPEEQKEFDAMETEEKALAQLKEFFHEEAHKLMLEEKSEDENLKKSLLEEMEKAFKESGMTAVEMLAFREKYLQDKKNEQSSNEELANHNAEKESHDKANELTIESLRAHIAEGEINADIEDESPASEGSAELLDQDQMYEVIKRTSYINATGNIIFLELGDSISGDLITQEYLDNKLVQKVTPILEE